MASLPGRELLYREKPPVSQNPNMDIGKPEKEKADVPGRLAVLLRDPDSYLNEIKYIYEQHDWLQYHSQ